MKLTRPALERRPTTDGASAQLRALTATANASKAGGAAVPERTQSFDPSAATAPGQALPPLLIERSLSSSLTAIDALEQRALPSSVAELIEVYGQLGLAVAKAQACLLESLDALDPRSGGGIAEPSAPHEALRQQAFDGLRRAGALFARIEPAFARLVHGDNAWPNQAIEVAPDRGDGRPLYHYRDTFKHHQVLGPEQRSAEYQQRVERFEKEGGRFEELITAQAGLFDSLEADRHYDYTMLPDGTTRLTPLPRPGETLPKCGHSLLAVGGAEFREQPVLCAGELWVIKDSAGDVEAVVVANNSGHFKPSFEDLENTLPHLEALGIERDKIIFFGGPNNLPSMFEEIAERFPELDPSNALPPSPDTVRQSLREGGVTPWQTRCTPRSGSGSPTRS